MYHIVANFEADWADTLKAELAALGFTAAVSDRPRELAIKLFNARKRRVAAKPRSVHTSHEISIPADHRTGYERLKKKIEDGDDLMAHLSTRVLKAKSNDGLLNDWAIHHLHLGITPYASNTAFVERTGPVLLAHFTDDASYLIDVVEHEHWSDQRYLQILKANWPELLVDVRLAGKVASTFTDADVDSLRRIGINSMLDVGGDAYAPVGGGYATSKVALDAVWYATMATSAVRRLQREVLKNAAQVQETLKSAGVPVADPIVLRARFESNLVFAIEEGSGAVVKFGEFPVLAG